jgi:hypothetical protein
MCRPTCSIWHMGLSYTFCRKEVVNSLSRYPYKASLQRTECELFWVTVGVPIYYILTHHMCRPTCSIWHMGLSYKFCRKEVVNSLSRYPYKANLQRTKSELFWVTVGVPIYYILTHHMFKLTCSICHKGQSYKFCRKEVENRFSRYPYKANIQRTQSALFWATVWVHIYYTF